MDQESTQAAAAADAKDKCFISLMHVALVWAQMDENVLHSFEFHFMIIYVRYPLYLWCFNQQNYCSKKTFRLF